MVPDLFDLVELTRDTDAGSVRSAAGLFGTPIRPAQLRGFVDDPNHLLWFAATEGTPVGFASGSILRHPDKPPQLFINEVDVAEPYQRRGIGRALVARLVEVARARGCDCSWLGTEVDNLGGNACFAAVPGVRSAGSFVLYEWDVSRDHG